jgi:predicted porin
MIKAKLFGAIACATFTATAAHAQSSVTVYGIVDQAVRYVNDQGVGHLKTLSSNGLRTSRFGLRGVEDLGDGLSAGFKLEAVMFPDTGTAGSASQAGQLWSRDAYVEIGHANYGTVRLGYDINPAYVTWYENDPWFNIGIAGTGSLYDTTQNGPLRAAFGAISKLDTTVTYTRNMVQYFSPNIGGFFAVAAAAAGEGGTTATGAAKQVSVRLGYTGNAFQAAVARARTDAQPAGGTVNRFTDSVATTSYDFGVAKLAATWREFKALTSKETHYFVAAIVPFGVSRVQATYGRVNMSGTVTTNLAPGTVAGSIDANDASMWAVGYIYNLSRRTSLYTNAVRIDNRGKSFLALAGGPVVNASNFGGKASSALEFGIAHNF